MGDFLGFPPHHTEMNYENLFKETHVGTYFESRKKFNRHLENIQKKEDDGVDFQTRQNTKKYVVQY